MIRRASHYMALPNDWADAHLEVVFAEALSSGKSCDVNDPEKDWVL